MLVEKYEHIGHALPDLACISVQRVLRVRPPGVSRHISVACKSYVLLTLESVPSHQSAPWAQLERVFTTSDDRVWVVVHMLSLCDPEHPLCPYTEVPLVEKVPTAVLLVLPASAVASPIRLMQVPRGEEDGPAVRYWIAWFISSGNFYYDEDRRFEYLTSHQLLLAHVH